MVYGSIYSTSRVNESECFNPDYATPTAALDMVTESLEAEQKFFDLFVEHDFLECAAADDAVLESNLMALNESFIEDVWTKILNFLKSIKDKIFSIFKQATIKIGALFTKDNAALVKKYKDQVDNNGNLDSLIIKGWYPFVGMKTTMDKINFAPMDAFDDIHIGTATTVTSEQDAKDEIARLRSMKKYNTAASVIAGNDMLGDSQNGNRIDFKTAFFKNPEDKKASEIKQFVVTNLTNHQDNIKKITTAKDTITKEIENMEKAAANHKKMYANAKGEQASSEKYIREVESVKADVAKSICSASSKAAGAIFQAAINAVKFDIKQCRAAYIRMATYKLGAGSKKADDEEVTDESTLVDAMIDADAYEVDSFFEQYSYDYEELTA